MCTHELKTTSQSREVAHQHHQYYDPSAALAAPPIAVSNLKKRYDFLIDAPAHEHELIMRMIIRN